MRVNSHEHQPMISNRSVYHREITERPQFLPYLKECDPKFTLVMAMFYIREGMFMSL